MSDLSHAYGEVTDSFFFVAFTLPQGYTGCAPTNIQSWAWTFWLPLLSFEVPVFILAIIKTVQVARDEYNSPHMMFILLRDSIMFFVIVLAVILVNCVIWASHNVSQGCPNDACALYL